MSDKTSIPWTDMTINPWIGCHQISPGCDNCYAKRQASRFYKDVTWGTDWRKWRTVRGFMLKALRAEKRAVRLGRPLFVFPSMCDPFYHAGADVNAFWRTVAEGTPHLVWLLLTKRPEWIDEHPWPKNVWLGVSAENQACADFRIPILLQRQCEVRFVSVEPMLGPVQRLREFLLSDYDKAAHDTQLLTPLHGFNYAKIHWVICGGESGPRARRMREDWALDLRDQCEGYAHFWFKQWGGAWGADMAHDDTLDGRKHHERPEVQA